METLTASKTAIIANVSQRIWNPAKIGKYRMHGSLHTFPVEDGFTTVDEVFAHLRLHYADKPEVSISVDESAGRFSVKWIEPDGREAWTIYFIKVVEV